MPQTFEQVDTGYTPPREEFEYRPVPPLAAVTAVLAAISLVFIAITEFVLPFAVLGVVLGIIASRQISTSNGELSGKMLVRTGLVVCALCVFGGSSWHAYVYATEVPEGYTRVSFVHDISRKEFPVVDGLQDYHPDVRALDGKDIFLKGYMYPNGRLDGIRQFILCKDSGECCFGGQPALTDMIFIEIPDHLPTASYYDGLVSIAGRFQVGDLRRTGELKPAYKIDATHFGAARKLY